MLRSITRGKQKVHLLLRCWSRLILSDPSPSFLNIILDTNPIAWAYLSSMLPLPRAITALLVFINAHLAFNQANKVAVIASHIDRAEILYPSPSVPESNGVENGADIEMADAPFTNGHSTKSTTGDDANFYRPFATIATSLKTALQNLLVNTPPSVLESPTTALAGALTLALTHANKITTDLTPDLDPSNQTITSITNTLKPPPAIHSRILVLSASPASPQQYIPLMNAIFASARLSIPIDVFALTPTSSTFLQQAASTTGGTFLSLKHPHGMLQTLLQGFLPSHPSRTYLIPATQSAVDFRAACFCHRKVVDVGFVCSICLSIFCEPPEGAVCLTCGTKLRLEDYGKKPVVSGKKKKRKRKDGEDSGVGTPVGRATPVP
jgi:transcription initiation factor TFIIH subunit 3